jgi:Tol biopolymer transport system component
LAFAMTAPETSNLFTIFYKAYDIVVVDYKTNTRRIIPSSYPDIDEQTLARSMWNGWVTTKYNSDQTRVIYPSGSIESDYAGESGQGYVLWDLVHKQKIVQVAVYDFSITPKWSPDGSKFAIWGHPDGNLLIVSRNGEVTQATDFRSFPNYLANKGWYLAEGYSWSPDGEKIGFWLTYVVPDKFENTTFVVLDTTSGKITDTCVQRGYISSDLSISEEAVWSHDGRYAVVRANQTKEGKFDVLLLDFEQGYAAKIAENLAPVGWLDTKK